MTWRRFLVYTACLASLPVAGPQNQTSLPPAGAAQSVLIVADDQGPMRVLADELSRRGRFRCQIVSQPAMPTSLADYHAIFMYIHGAMEHTTERALIDYALAGGRLVILHHGIASARRNNPEWLDLTGIRILPADDATAPWRVIHNTTHTMVNLAPGHFITTHNVRYDRRVTYLSSDQPAVEATFAALDLPDTEVFLNQHFSDGRAKTVLFGFRCVDPQTGTVHMQDRCGWLKPVGAGWILYFQPGHTAQDFRHQGYLQILFNSLIWRASRHR